ncbi:hypothetical protein QOZ80_6AG0526010 [Eleusine coracana subsp. coracana]|nr:hypothetical protein QOZ80_6AG0526010 [Eleusine coracana subsp. coracana]
MEPLETLQVRFHIDGEFMHSGRKLHYVGGTVVMSYIDRDKISFPEIVGHLRDHCNVLEGVKLHWLIPGKELKDGLQVLWDDNSYLKMARCIVDGVAEVYVEVRSVADDNCKNDIAAATEKGKTIVTYVPEQ